MTDALVVVDLQAGFDDPALGPRGNPDCARNTATLVEHWRATDRPVVFVRHDSVEPGSPLRPGTPGNAFMPELTGEPDLLVAKQVHSAFAGDPDLDGWLRARGIGSLTLCGITTDHCVSTTARVACDLGYDVRLVLDATSAFPRTAPSGRRLSADEVADAAAASLDGEFARVVDTADALAT